MKRWFSFALFDWMACLSEYMEIIETQRHRNPSREELRLFLGAVRDAAQEDGHFKIASITLATRRLDPLAVLESIYEQGEFHFYLERPSEDRALAGAEAVVLGQFSGPDRCGQARDWAEDILEHTVAVGDLEAPAAGPRFYVGLTFEDEAPENAPFAPATLFLPRWQVCREHSMTTAVANFRVDADAELEPLVEKLWAAHEKFMRFSYSSVTPPPPRRLLACREAGAEAASDVAYCGRVEAGLAGIAQGRYGKIVVARAVDLEFDQPFNPLITLNGLRARFRECFAFSFENDHGQSFIGATPERLVEVRTGTLRTEALAGSAPRGLSAREDARLAQGLLDSEKDLREHRHVVDSIRKRLAALGIDCQAASAPEILALANVQHLRTPISARLDGRRHILEVVAALHPTPAVGGSPREAAIPDIARIEPFCRGLYAGVLGWFDHSGDGEFCVGLRAGLVDANAARIYAGAGIVAGSDPLAEWQETEMKISALRDALSSGLGDGGDPLPK